MYASLKVRGECRRYERSFVRNDRNLILIFRVNMYEHGEFESFHTCDMALHDMTDMKAQAYKGGQF